MTVSRFRQRASAARRAHLEERRRIVLDAAEALVTREGLSQFSMRLLAREAGIPAPTLYGYFDSREAVLGAVADRKIGILRSYILREAEQAEPGIGRLMAFARGYRRFALDGAYYYDLFISRTSILSSEGVRELASGPGIELIRTLAVDVEAAIERGELPTVVDPERMIIGLWAVAHGFLSLELRNVLPGWQIAEDEREAAYLQYFEAMLRGYQDVTPGPGARPEAG